MLIKKHIISTRHVNFIFGLILMVACLFTLPNITHAQDARFGYSVDGTEVNLDVLSPENDLYFYGWSFGEPCAAGETDCYQETGSNVSVADMWGYVGDSTYQTDIYLEVYDESGDNLIASTTALINLGGEEADSDGDEILDRNESAGCEDDPDPECGEDNGGGNGGGGDDDGGDGSTAGLVNCGDPGADGVLQDSEMCGYDDLINLVSQLIQWLIGILILVATLLFTYAGFLYLFADGNSNQAQKAKNIFTNVASGFAIVLLSVVFITTIVTMFTNTDWEDNWMDVVPLPEVGVQIDTVPLDSNSYS